ncbi:hypothetical protein BYT27DRAFT_7244898 [Phlegmacium glaucopus]|nr:hypothetical protein BYT27DRAFT_7244898 [Phlegmacium glaucopus]
MPRLIMVPTTLQTLPVELICYIFANLEIADLLTCSTVTKTLRKIITDSSRLQYTIELAKYRMVSLLPASASPPLATRLRLLRDRERAWKHVDWKKRHTLKLPPTGSVYEFVGGLYGNGREDDSRVTASISFLELPSTDALFLGQPPHELQTWTHSMADVAIVDFTMDPSQDLLVLVALAPAEEGYVYELHLRSIKTNQPHPKAPLPMLPCLFQQETVPPTLEVMAAIRVQVAGNMVALLIKEIHETTGAHLEIWNWENSPQFSCSLASVDEIDDFTFLTHNSFLLVRPTGRFEVYTFAEPVSSSTTPYIKATYGFPALSDGYIYWYISMSSNPAPGYVPRSRSDIDRNNAIPGGNRQLYYPNPDERIHACCLYIFKPTGEEDQNHHDVHSFVFFLNIQTLLNPPAEWLVKKPSPFFNNNSHSATTPTTRRTARNSAAMDTGSDSSSSSFSTSSSPVAPPNSPTLPSSSSSLFTPVYPPFPTFNHFPTHPSNPIPPVHSTPSLSPSSTSSSRRSGSSRTSVASLSAGVFVPWEVWGPQSTRWFEECLSTDWQHAIYGLRTVESICYTKRRGLNFTTTRPPPPATQPGNPSKSNGTTSNKPIYKSVMVQATEGPTSAMAVNSAEESVTTSDQLPSTQEDSPNEESEDSQVANAFLGERNFLRIRDFNPYSFTRVSEPDTSNGKGKHKARWRAPRLVTETSKTSVKGVFTRDIESSLPYMEVISEDAFEVTDVMMDDCRLLLLQRGQGGKLNRVEVLMM